ncbi:methyl-accepting chemotaxis protein [Salipaludibacillus aurantiacus]|uniref:Methyl-accepting chemotaxis protein n=2 Tax=Salipaludibacillus aurantiacus TaxID=1601833 RepID=A0A1H9RW33_9BACI|nr:methyl-accepting chemotaxis protein [Salipaludibacillus aurantiacus]
MRKLNMKHFSLTRKYGIVFIFTAGLFLASALFVAYALNNVQQDVEEMERSGERAVILTDMAQLFEERYALLLEYLFIPEPGVEEAFAENGEAFTELLHEIEPYLDTEEMQSLINLVRGNAADINELFFSQAYEVAGDTDNLVFINVIKDRGETIKNRNVYSLQQLRQMVDEERAQAADSTHQSLYWSSSLLLFSFLISLILAVLLLLIISRNVKKRLSVMIGYSRKITSGELDIENLHDESRDELGQISHALDELKERLALMMGHISETSTNVKNKTDFLTEFTDHLKDNSLNVHSSMQTLLAGIEEQSQSFVDISESVSINSDEINQLLASSEKMNQSAKEIAELTTEGNRKMEASVNQIENVRDVVDESNYQVKVLGERSQEISRFVKSIKDIAEQTNLLALNASIEAARAGQHGRGFSVVAGEIRKLSEEVAVAVREITSIVNKIQHDTGEVGKALSNGAIQAGQGVNQIHETGSYFKQIFDRIGEMEKLVSDNTDSVFKVNRQSGEISQVIERTTQTALEASEKIEQVTHTIDQQQQQVEEVAANSEDLQATTLQLNGLISQYHKVS